MLVCVCGLLVLNSKKGEGRDFDVKFKKLGVGGGGGGGGRVAYTHLVPCKEVKASQVYTLNVFTFHQSFLSQFLVVVFCFFGVVDAFCSRFPPSILH